ncbi:MAG: phosphatidate cytidylyltransferase [Acidimicrobiaceae bacterium]|nr:phosphatidate cytidylyltransferase [Acidimicrobiia bacterium]MCY4494959.1 phosphatidate cytidylyltransferase [Acidimicrobiaceae bacterium]
MSQQQDKEGFRVQRTDPVDDDVAPGRSVFGDAEISFEDDDAAVPHWSQPPTGAVPKVRNPAESVTFKPQSRPAGAEPVPEDYGGWAGDASEPSWAEEAQLPPPPKQPSRPVDADADAFFAHDDGEAVPPQESAATPLSTALGVTGAGDRDFVTATIVGLGLGALILAAMAYREWVAVGVVTVVLAVAAVEFFNAARVGGLQPAVLLGVAAVASMPLAVYWRGESAAGLVLVMSVVFGALWYLVVAPSDSPVRGLGSTMLGILHIGLLGSYAALMLSIPDLGTGMLTTAIIITVCYDTGGLVVGRTMGRSPLSAASPNKTLEGLIGGVLAAVGAAFAMGLLSQPSPFADVSAGGGFADIMILGIAAAIAAPIGDLAESQIKRDLGIKDMGSILPSHGGVLDRFDSLLFVLPTTFYVSRFVLL